MAMHIAKLNPNISVMVQDLEESVNQAIGYFNGFGPELLEEERADFMPFDFFKDSPVPDCDYYYVGKFSLLLSSQQDVLITIPRCS